MRSIIFLLLGVSLAYASIRNNARTSSGPCDGEGSLGYFCTDKDLDGDCDYFCESDYTWDVENSAVLAGGLSSFILSNDNYVWYLYYPPDSSPAKRWTFRGGYTDNLEDFPGMNDNVFYLYPEPASGNPAVSLFENARYEGRSAYYEEGNYPTMSVEEYDGYGTITGSSLSSVLIFNDAVFTYYKDTNYGTPLATYTVDTDQVADNDQCNSFIVSSD